MEDQVTGCGIDKEIKNEGKHRRFTNILVPRRNFKKTLKLGTIVSMLRLIPGGKY